MQVHINRLRFRSYAPLPSGGGSEDPIPGGVELLTPSVGTKLSGEVEMRVRAYDPAGLTGVIFYMGGFEVGTDFEGPDNISHEYSVIVDTTALPNGPITFGADVYKVPGVLAYSLPSQDFWIANLPEPTSPLPPAGYSLVFEDNFDTYDLEIVGFAHIVNDQWHDHVWYAGYPPSGSQYVEDGILHLVSKESDGYPQITMSTYHPAADPKISFKQGYFETRLRWTGGQGSWPAFWLIGTAGADNPNYPDPPPGFPDPTVLSGEIDILEAQGSKPDYYYGTLHRNTNGLWSVPDESAPDPAFQRMPFDFANEWHIISGLWTETEIVWYIDHKEIYRTDTFDSTDQEMMLILQMEVGGWEGGADGTSPAEFHAEFDYVRVWQL